MARTKKKRNYKKAPKNTRVFRCVQKVKKKHEIGAAIAICQSSTKQSYRTGRSLKGGNGKKKVKIPKKGIAETDGKGLPKPLQYLQSDIDKYKNLPAFEDDRERILVGGRRKKKTRKKRGKGGVFSCPGCGDKKKKKKERDFYTVTDSYGNKQKLYYSDDDSYSSDEDLKPMDDSEQEEEMPQPVRRRLVRIPSEDSLKLGSEKIKEWHRSRSTSPTMDPGTAAHHNLPKDHFADVDAILKKAAQKGLGGGRRKKKTRKKRGGEKSKRVKNLIKIFQQYPEIFPSGYFRFLGARLQNHIDKKTLWYKNGVILTWIKYQKTVKKKPKCIIKPGDVKLDQIVNKNQGNGAAKKIVLQFLKKFEKNRIWLEVRANNKRAIKFYRDRGFKKVCNIKFGEIPGIMMVKN